MKTLLLAALAASALVPASAALARPMTATDMHMMHRMGSPSVSPDGRTVIFTLSDTDLKANKRKNTLYSLDLTRAGAQPVKVAGVDGHSAVYGGDGAIWFIGDRGALYRLPKGQARAHKVGDLPDDIGGFKVSANGSRLLVWADRPDCPDLGCKATSFPAKSEGSGRTYDQLFVRHWDTWAEPGVKSRLYAFPLASGKIAGPEVRLTGNLVGDVPSKPFGGGEEIAISADGKTVYFALREAGRIEATSTNLDIFMVPADGSATPRNLTADNDGTDNIPALSPDGRRLAWLSMARAGYESDRNVVKVLDLATGKVTALTARWDRSPGDLAWTPDGRALLASAGDVLEHPVFRIDATSGAVTKLTANGNAGNVIPLATGGALMTINSVQAPDDLYRLDAGGRLTQLTNVNKALLSQLDPVTMEKYSFKGANGDTVWGMKVKPARATGKLPIAFLVHGGPQGSFGNGWSYRWNPRLFTAPGYAAVSVDFHGSTGYGQAFTDSINNDWGGKPLEDLQKGLAHVTATDASLDGKRVCALGASYGGYMMNWIAGRWPDRFNCLVQHDGVFDARAMAYETEELWFDEWEHGGKTYYQDPKAFERWNPVNYVANWKTPMLVITGEKDFRIPYTQGLASFTALQRRNVPSRLVVFPDENHWVLKPKNSIQWYDEVFGWMAKWMGQPKAQ